MTEKEKQEETVQEGVHNYSAADAYVWPEDPKVRQKLEWFQDQKLALMMHWGPYSQLGLWSPGPYRMPTRNGREKVWTGRRAGKSLKNSTSV